jgi:uncharacterized protein
MNKEILKYGSDILSSENMQKEKCFLSHGTTSCYTHSLRVADMSVSIAKKLKLKANHKFLVRGALLHDYYLYDWHEKDASHKWHGFFHAGKALKNANRDFTLSEEEMDIIEKHMFPLNLSFPKYIESWIVCIADKICATMETTEGKIKKLKKKK